MSETREMIQGALPSAQCAETGTSANPVAFTISNTEPRRTVDGEILDAHDGCLEFFSGQYYLYGTRYGETNGFGKTNRYVCYSSPDLVHWNYRGELLPDAPKRTYYRPYVKYNKATRKYVLWYNADNGYGVAVADAPTGPYQIQNPSVRLKHGNLGVGDFGLLVDEDGAAYIAYNCVLSGHFEVKEEPIPHHKIAVEKLTPDYLASTMEGSDFVAGNCESPAMFKRGALYYLLFDNTCCFGANGSGARVYTASHPLGPFTYWGNINVKTDHPRDLPIAWTEPGTGRPDCIIRAQQTHIATLPSPSGPLFIWMGDRWHSTPDKIKGHDFQYWSSPLQFEEDGMIRQLRREDQWSYPAVK
ncbi:MAG: family 43 glycosylhydrolase [Verrucomicrobiota bacterium]